jgi:hypothetical protein
MMNHQANPFGGRGQMMGSPYPFGGGNPMMGQMMGRPQQGRRSGGGLLSKLLGGKSQDSRTLGLGGITGAGGAGSGGGVSSIIKTLSNPEGLTGILNNTQQVLKTVESIGPMIQQYGPLVKNLPMMWKLYKGFKDLPSGETAENSTSEAPDVEKESAPKKVIKTKNTHSEAVETKNTHSEAVETKKPQQKTSVPKLYI